MNNKKINKSWKVGEQVKIGFLTLIVVKHLPYSVLLKHNNGKFYEFTPYQGLNSYEGSL